MHVRNWLGVCEKYREILFYVNRKTSQFISLLICDRCMIHDCFKQKKIKINIFVFTQPNLPALMKT